MPTHTCPRPGCAAQVPDELFACRGDWFALSLPVRHAIYATARRRLLDRVRLAAVKAAREEWRLLNQRAACICDPVDARLHGHRLGCPWNREVAP
jgi:hypothetical protein